MTVGLLPEQLRAEFGLALTPRNERRFQRWLRIMAAVFPRLPARIRHTLHDHELAELRRSLNDWASPRSRSPHEARRHARPAGRSHPLLGVR